MSKTVKTGPAPVSCSNEYIRAMLVPFAERSLSKSNREEVAAHLEECRFCRDDVSRIKEVLRSLYEVSKNIKEPVYDEHPSHEKLFTFIMDSGSLSENEKKRVSMHAFFCRKCREELDMLRQADEDFKQLPSGESLNWILPSHLKNALRPAEVQLQSISAENIEIPRSERIFALLNKFDLRLGMIVGASALIIFCGLCFVMCDSDAEEPAEEQAAALSEKQNNWVDLDIGSLKNSQVCQSFNKENIKYRISEGRLQSPLSDAKRALDCIKDLQLRSSGSSAKEFTVIEDQASESVSENSEEPYEQNSETADSISELKNNISERSDSEKIEYPKDDYYDYGQVADDEPPAASESSYPKASEASSEAEKRSEAPAKKINASVVKAVTSKAKPADKEYSSVRTVQPSHPIKKTAVPVRTYKAAAYKQSAAEPERRSISEPVVTSSVKSSGAPVPVSVPIVSKPSKKELPPPEPEIIRPASDASSLSEKSMPEYAEEGSVQVPKSQVSDFVTGGNTYNSDDSVTNRDIIE